MKIELKNIHYSEQLSEETSAFSADLYISGIKAGTASNRGQGGPTDYYAVNEQGKKLIAEAEAYCKTLPPETFTAGEREYDIDMDLELFIDNLLTRHLQEKELQKFRRKLDKASENGIVIGIPDKSFRMLAFKFPVDMLLVHPNGPSIIKDVIVKRVIPNFKEGEMILNTNIPETILKEAGLKPGQYASFAEKAAKKPQKRKGRSM